MATKAYLMIHVKEEFNKTNQIEAIVAELRTIPEVKCIESADGACDLLVHIVAPIRAVFTANKVMVKEWVKDLRILKVEPLYIRGPEELDVPEVPELPMTTESRLVAWAEEYIAAAAAKGKTRR